MVVNVEVPTASEVVVNFATPPVNVPVPSVVDPSLKVTIPEGDGSPKLESTVAEVTVAVNVTACPNVDGFWEDVSVVVVRTLVDTCCNVADVLLR